MKRIAMNREDIVLIRSRSLSEALSVIGERVTSDLTRLLKAAKPSREKRYRLEKTLRDEVPGSDENLREKISKYYELPFEYRTKAQFRKIFGIDPYPWLHQQFVLDFSNASVSETELSKLASNLRHLFKNEVQVILDAPDELLESDFLHLVLYKMVSPNSSHTFGELSLTGFLKVWERASFVKWGSRYEDLFLILNEAARFQHLSGERYQALGVPPGFELEESGFAMDLSQTDLDWMKALIVELDLKRELPPYPLSRGPTRPVTRKLEKIARDYNRLKGRPMAPVLEYAVRFLCEKVLSAYGQKRAA